MRKIILLIITTVFLSYNSKAQEYIIDYRNKLQFGLRMGINYSNVYDSKGEEFDSDPKFGFATGAFVAIPIGTYLGVQPEILFSQKGFQATGQILGSPYDFTRTTSYIDIPIFFALKPSTFLTILAGPQYSYLVKKRDVFTNAASTVAQEQEFENDNVRKNIMGFTGGVDLSLSHLVIAARVGWDLMNNNGDGTSTTPRYKNVYFQTTLGYRFYSE